jgi:hypothetical protein
VIVVNCSVSAKIYARALAAGAGEGSDESVLQVPLANYLMPAVAVSHSSSTPKMHEVATLCTGRSFTNEGFNTQKNGGFALEHAYSKKPVASKVFYFLLQMAHLLFHLPFSNDF